MPMKTILFLLSVTLYDVCSSAPQPYLGSKTSICPSPPQPDLGINRDCMKPAKVSHCRPDTPKVVVYTFHLATCTCRKISGCYPDSSIRQDNNLFRSELGCHLWCNNIFE